MKEECMKEVCEGTKEEVKLREHEEGQVVFPTENVCLPYRRYQSQSEYMKRAALSVEEGKNGLLQSPYGTGKSLLLLAPILEYNSGQSTENKQRVVYICELRHRMRHIIENINSTQYTPRVSYLGMGINPGGDRYPKYPKYPKLDLDPKYPDLDPHAHTEIILSTGSEFFPLWSSNSHSDLLHQILDNAVLVIEEGCSGIPPALYDALSLKLSSNWLTIIYTQIGKYTHNIQMLQGEGISYQQLMLLSKIIFNLKTALCCSQYGSNFKSEDIWSLLEMVGMTNPMEKEKSYESNISKGRRRLRKNSGGSKKLTKILEQGVTQETYKTLLKYLGKLESIFSSKQEVVGALYKLCTFISRAFFLKENNYLSNTKFTFSKDSTREILQVKCISPSLLLGHIKSKSNPRCIILSTYALSANHNLSEKLQTEFPISIRSPHIISLHPQFFIRILTHCPHSLNFNFTGANKNNVQQLSILLGALTKIMKSSPGGGVIVFSERKFMLKFENWRKQDSSFNKAKGKVYVEPKDPRECGRVLSNYYYTIRTDPKRGAILLADAYGHILPHLNFQDNRARIIIFVGVPTPNPANPHNISRRKIMGDVLYKEWEREEGLGRVRRACGRVVSHMNDYGACLLIDEQYREYRHYFPSWMTPYISSHGYNTVFNKLQEFFTGAEEADSEMHTYGGSGSESECEYGEGGESECMKAELENPELEELLVPKIYSSSEEDTELSYTGGEQLKSMLTEDIPRTDGESEYESEYEYMGNSCSYPNGLPPAPKEASAERELTDKSLDNLLQYNAEALEGITTALPTKRVNMERMQRTSALNNICKLRRTKSENLGTRKNRKKLRKGRDAADIADIADKVEHMQPPILSGRTQSLEVKGGMKKLRKLHPISPEGEKDMELLDCDLYIG